MKTLLFCFTFAFIGSAAYAEVPAIKRIVSEKSRSIREDLDKTRWSIETGDDYILIKSLFKLETHSRASPALTKTPNMVHYVIKLTIKKELPKVEYITLAQARAVHAATLNYGTKTKAEWHQSFVFLRDNPLPRYTVSGTLGENYSVYLDSSGDFVSSFSPMKAFAEAKGVEAIVDGCLWPLAQ